MFALNDFEISAIQKHIDKTKINTIYKIHGRN